MNSAGHKIVDAPTASHRAQEAQAGGGRVVFTNGCFDLLHAGHVRYLTEARGLGDMLMVGLNSDQSVRTLGKGTGRPVIPAAQRAEVLASLAVVDLVVIFDQPTPLELIRAIQPDVLVKGGDYTVPEIVGHEVVFARGGRVLSLPLVDGISTSDIIKRIRELPE